MTSSAERILVITVLLLLTALPACAGDDDDGTPAAFTLSATPTEVADSAPGQRVVLLVTAGVTSAGRGAGQAIALTASASGAEVLVEPEGGLTPGKVAEVTVIPSADLVSDTGGTALLAAQPEPLATVEVTISGEREGLTSSVTIPVGVGADGDWPLAEAERVRDLFVPWLAEQHPELGIGPDTEWVATVTKPHWLVVSYYLFLSDRWEMGVRWHIMIPPDNWAEIYLRERFVEVQPTRGFKVDSWTPAPTEIHPVEVSEPVWR